MDDKKREELIIMQLKKIFDLPVHTYATVERYKGITFEVRTKENGHNIPHFHAKYGNTEISVSLIDFKIIKNSNMKIKQIREAIEFAKEHKDYFIKNWEKYHGQIIA